MRYYNPSTTAVLYCRNNGKHIHPRTSPDLKYPPSNDIIGKLVPLQRGVEVAVVPPSEPIMVASAPLKVEDPVVTKAETKVPVKPEIKKPIQQKQMATKNEMTLEFEDER